MMKVRAYAPTRIDFAGGTVDVYPIYVIQESALTINAAIDIPVNVTLERRTDDKITIRSISPYGFVTINDRNQIPIGQPLGLVRSILKSIRPCVGIDVTIDSKAPISGGLGASSAISVCLVSALSKLHGNRLEESEIISLGMNCEASFLQIPCGVQDYVASMRGGFNLIWLGTQGIDVESIKPSHEFISQLSERIVLCDTLERSNHAITWEIFKAFFDGNRRVRQALSADFRIAKMMSKALIHEDVDSIAQLLREEWQLRCRLSRHIEGKRLNYIIRRGSEAGSISARACGEGGGGCVIFIVRPGKRQTVIEALEKLGCKVIDFGFSNRGLTSSLSGVDKLTGLSDTSNSITYK
ncbi:MAG: hypothetical protein ACRECH_10910 [Nitrososphaerales archaeon]